MEQPQRQEINFADGDAAKLKQPVFPTIRKTDGFGKAGYRLNVTFGDSGEYAGLVQVLDRTETILGDIPVGLMKYDTGTSRLNAAIESLQSHYNHPPQQKDVVYIYWMEWIRREKEL